MNINEIEKLTFDEAKKIALDSMKIKDHDCIFADLGGAFGFSVLVFRNGKHIYYANDYALHHPSKRTEGDAPALKEYYIEEMKRKLFKDSELTEPIATYDEYTRKDYFLRNYWIMQYDRLSIFGIGEEAQKAFDEKKPNFPFYNPVSFCYVSDRDIINKQKKYAENIKNQYAKLKDSVETFREMVSRELANHEACITCSYTDALSSLGLIFEELTKEKQKIVKEELSKQIQMY